MPDRRAELAQRWEAHHQPQQLAVVDDLGGGRFGLRGLRREEEALLTAPADVAWLLAELGRLDQEAQKWRTAWREDTGNDEPAYTAPTCPVAGKPCASPLCQDMGCDLVTDLKPGAE